MRQITAVGMVYSDGQKSVYAVYRTMLHEGKKPYWDMNDHRSVEVGRVTKTKDESPAWMCSREELGRFYYDMAAPFAAPEWPAFVFGHAEKGVTP